MFINHHHSDCPPGFEEFKGFLNLFFFPHINKLSGSMAYQSWRSLSVGDVPGSIPGGPFHFFAFFLSFLSFFAFFLSFFLSFSFSFSFSFFLLF
jgi:hypothetical protein